MKITTFNPLIVTKDAENVIKLFEALGFEKRHSLDANTGTEDFTNVRMKNADGFYVDISNVPVPQDMTLIRMNVDDFDRRYKDQQVLYDEVALRLRVRPLPAHQG